MGRLAYKHLCRNGFLSTFVGLKTNSCQSVFFERKMIVMKEEVINTYLTLALQAAVQAGREILKIYHDPQSDFGIERKADNSPLTLADKKAHAVIAERLSQAPFPLLSEEGRHTAYAERQGWPALWIVDPLDGTKEFIKKNGEFTVNIAWVEGGVPRMGVIYVPVKRDLYFAAEGWGAYKLTDVFELEEADTCASLRERALRLPRPKTGDGPFVIVASRSHLSPETETFIHQMEAEHPRVEVVSSGSSIKICLVAEGVADVYPRFAPTMEWDTAAGHAIARAAGKEVFQAESSIPLQYNKEDLLNPWFVVK